MIDIVTRRKWWKFLSNTFEATWNADIFMVAASLQPKSYFAHGEKRRPKICLRSQATFEEALSKLQNAWLVS